MNKTLFHRPRTLLIAVPLALVIGFVTPGAAFANPGSSSTPPTPAPRQVLSAAETANINALLAATPNNSEGVPVFDVELARSLGASKEAIEQYGAAFATAGGNLANASSLSSLKLDNELSAGILATAASCRGSNGFIGMFWFGPQLALNSCNTAGLINGIVIAASGGGGYVAIGVLRAAGVPGAAIAAVVSAILGVGVGFLNWCRDASSIGAIYLNGGSPLAPPTCWAQ